MSPTTVVPEAAEASPRPVPSPPLPSPRIANTWLRRLRRRVRAWTAAQPPADDGWVPAGGHVVVIAPHPDDEVIGCGGTIRRHVRAGDPVSIIYLTRGENSRGFPWLSPLERQAKRMEEAQASCAVLGVREAVFLDGADGRLAEPAVLNEISTKLAREIALRAPKVIYVPHADDNHPDHAAAYRMVVQTASEATGPAPIIYQYELWSPLAADFAVDVSREMKAKLKAIKCHALALDAFDYIPTMLGLAAYRSGTLLQRRGYAEAFKRAPDVGCRA